MNKLLRFFLLLFVLIPRDCASQTDADTTALARLLELPLEDLLDYSLYSASKTAEKSFETPLSSSVVTREQIKNAGCTSIMEALRLAPGVIVREQTNGNYDIHLEGLDNLAPNSNLVHFANSTTLVMIDERPIYSYVFGGTYWENLSIGIADVEQIEIIRGPCAAMYGPNAVTGVINIITRKNKNDGYYAVANMMRGNYNSLIINSSVGNRFNDKLSVIVSGNFMNKERTQDASYYDVVADQYVPIDSVTAVKSNKNFNPSAGYPDPALSFRKQCINGFVEYDPARDIHFVVSVGSQNSMVQKELRSGLTPISTNTSETAYGSVKGNIRDLTILCSQLRGTETILESPVAWDFNTTDVFLEYNIKTIKNLIIRPGLSYRLANYDDRKYVNTAIKEGLWNGIATTETKSASLYTDYKMFEDKLRLIASGRLDKFNYPEKLYTSYQFAATYLLNDKNLIRASYGQAYRTPLILDEFTDFDRRGAFPVTNPAQTYVVHFKGNRDLRLLSGNMADIGYRSKLNANLQLKLTLFDLRTRDYTESIATYSHIDSAAPVSFSGEENTMNLPLKAEEYGAIVNFTYDDNKHWQAQAFITIQQTWLYDYAPYYNTAQAPPLVKGPLNFPTNNSPYPNNINSGLGTRTRHLATPNYYGGIYVNWHPIKKWNFNINSYFYGAQTQLEISNLAYQDGNRGVQHINAKVLLNAMVSYKPVEKLTFSADFRNILNDHSREFYKSDQTAFLFLGCASFEL